MPKINQLDQASRLSNTDLLAIEASDGSNTRGIAYKNLRLQLQNESKSVFALHGEIASNDQVAQAVSDFMSHENIQPWNHVVIDNTLTMDGQAADAKAAGNLIVINGTSGSSTKVNIITSDTDIKLAEMRDVDNLAVHNACNYIPNALNAQYEQNGITWTDLGNGVMSYSGEMIDPTLGSQTRYYYSTALLPDWAEYGKKYYVKVESDNPKLCLSPIFYNSDGGTISTLYFYSDGTFEIPSNTVGMQIRALMMPNATVSGTEYIRCSILSADSNASLTSKVEELSEKAPRLYDYNAYNYIGNALNKTGKSSTGTMTFTDLGNGLVSYIGNTEANTQFLFYSDTQNLPEWAEREKTYYIKSKTDNLSVTFNIYCYDSNGNILSGSYQSYSDDGGYVIPADAVGMVIRIYAPAGTNITELSYIKVAILNADSNESLSKEIDHINHYGATKDEVIEEGARLMGYCNSKVDDAVTPLDIRLDEIDEEIDHINHYGATKDEVIEEGARLMGYCNSKVDDAVTPLAIRVDGLTIRCNLYDNHFTNLDTKVGNLEARADIPQPPSANGSYTLKATVNNGRVSYSWQLQA